MNEKNNFLPLTNDLVFKTLWYRYLNDKYVKEFLEGIIEYAIERPLGNYTLGPNETGILSYEDIANKLDISLVNKEENWWIDIELNRLKKEKSDKNSILATERKSEFYLTKVYNNAYNNLGDNKYKVKVIVEQVNLDYFYSLNGKEIEKELFIPYDIDNKIAKDWLKEHHLYLPRERDLCYSLDDEERKDFALLLSETKEEREKLAIGSKKRERIVEIVEELERDENFMSLKDKEEFEQALRDIAYKNGVEEGIEQGIEKGKIEMIKSLYTNKVELKDIAKYAETSVQNIKNILEIN